MAGKQQGRVASGLEGGWGFATRERNAMQRLEGKVAIVSGSARGAGAVIARVLVDEGASVVLVDVKDELGEKVAADIGDRALYVHCDITREEDWERAVAGCVERFGKVTTLVNNAAVLHVA